MGILLAIVCFAALGIGCKWASRRTNYQRESEANFDRYWKQRVELDSQPVMDIDKLSKITNDYLSAQYIIDDKYPKKR